MRYFYSILSLILFFNVQAQNVQDDFEGGGTISSWYGDDCGMNINAANPYQLDMNLSNTVLEYHDTGGQYANVQFDINSNYDLTLKNSFSLKVYVPSTGLTGNQANQISLKLQDKTIGAPWTTQSEIIKPIVLDQWQEVTFNFETDSYINLDPNSLPPIQRTDFNRVVIQVNGENNNDHVLAYIDDLLYLNIESDDPVYDNLVWSDEFDTDGTIDNTKWFHQTQLPAGNSWYNGEIQHYTNRIENSFVSGGHLNLVAKKETFSDQGVTKQYTSARLNSKFAFTYGKVEIRAQLPSGVGTWPAMWMLGKNIDEDGAYWDNLGYDTTSWPACGEIDIMEHWGDNQNFVQSAIHSPSSFGNTFNKGGQIVSTASTGFHVYTLEWSPEKMVFSVDGVQHYTYNPEVKNADTWPFYQEQYLLLNTAILPNISPAFSESAMIIDYVRVYQESPLSVSEFEDTASLKFYPNPVSTTIHIEAGQITHQNVDLVVADISGRIVSQKQLYVADSEITYNTAHLNSGIYFMTLLFDNGSTNTIKFIKK